MFFGSSDVDRAKEAARSQGASGGGVYKEAVEFGDVLVLSTSWSRTKSAVRQAGDFGGKVLIDITNPEESGALVVGQTTSGAEQVADWAQGARVVKAFNHVYGQLFDLGPFGKSGRHTLFYCGDDSHAKSVVAGLIRETGYGGVDAGPLMTARYLEPLAMLMVALAKEQGRRGGDFAIELQLRPE
jgi:predicted dinucleotide-binding enzyme